jgi:hypothetical protein
MRDQVRRLACYWAMAMLLRLVREDRGGKDATLEPGDERPLAPAPVRVDDPEGERRG